VVDGVEGLGSVQQKDKPLRVVDHALEEELVNVLDVGVTTDTGKEAALGWVKKSGDCRHNGPGNGAGQEAIIGIGHTDRASVRDETRVLLGEQEEEPVIEAGWRGKTTEKGIENAREDLGREIGGGTPGGKGDAIGWNYWRSGWNREHHRNRG